MAKEPVPLSPLLLYHIARRAADSEYGWMERGVVPTTGASRGASLPVSRTKWALVCECEHELWFCLFFFYLLSHPTQGFSSFNSGKCISRATSTKFRITQARNFRRFGLIMGVLRNDKRRSERSIQGRVFIGSFYFLANLVVTDQCVLGPVEPSITLPNVPKRP